MMRLKVWWTANVQYLFADRKGRERIVDALGSMPTRTAVRRLLSALGDPEGDISRLAGHALGRIGDRRAVGPLIQILEQPDRLARCHAADALARLGDRQAVPALLTALQGDDEWVVPHVIDALKELGDPRAAEPLIQALRSLKVIAKDENVRRRAVIALGNLGQPAAAGVLREFLVDSGAGVRAEAAEALGKLGDRGTAAALLPLLADRDWSVRMQAARALGRLGDELWVTVVQGDDDDFARLGRSGDPRALGPLVARLDADSAQAAMALGELGDPRAVPALIRALDRTPTTAAAAFSVLEARFADDDRVREACGRYRDAQAAALKARAALDELPESQLTIDQLVDRLKRLHSVDAGAELARRADRESERVVEALLTALGDDGMRKRLAQLKASRQWRDSDAGYLVLEMTRRLLAESGAVV